MTFDVVTIFPELVERMVSTGVVGRGREAGLLDIAVHDLRDFADDRHRTVDDAPYGGGPGMVLKPAPFIRALAAVRETRGDPDTVILLSPQGATLTHDTVMRLSRLDHVVLLCGRYEGVDERVRTHIATEELSIGDYVVSGGELPAGVVVEAVARQVPGVVGNTESVEGDSFVRRILDHPHYTRPASLAELEETGGVRLDGIAGHGAARGIERRGCRRGAGGAGLRKPRGRAPLAQTGSRASDIGAAARPAGGCRAGRRREGVPSRASVALNGRPQPASRQTGAER